MIPVRSIALSERWSLGSLLEPKAPSDALAAYYALEYPANRTRLYGYYTPSDQVVAFLIMAQTGLDLFRPLVIPFTHHPEALTSLVRHGLNVGQPAILHLPLDQASWLETLIEFVAQEISELFRFDPTRFSPLLNVLLVQRKTPDGQIRFEIRSEDHMFAASGINWTGTRFAEVYLSYLEESFNPVYIRSVLSAAVSHLLQQKRIPLLRLPQDDEKLQSSVAELGFTPSGIKSVIGPIQRI